MTGEQVRQLLILPAYFLVTYLVLGDLAWSIAMTALLAVAIVAIRPPRSWPQALAVGLLAIVMMAVATLLGFGPA